MTDSFNHISVFVDNSNSGIKYTGNWTHMLGLPTDLSTVTAPDSQRTPWYGTLSQSLSSGARISYVFNGTDLVAYFRNTNTTAIKSCTIDGQPQSIEKYYGASTACFSVNKIPSGPHNLTIILNGEDTVQFDGLTYIPQSSLLLDAGVDVSYEGLIPGGKNDALQVTSTGDGGQITNPGDSLRVEFTGISLSIYASVRFLNATPTPFQYIVDDYQPTNFTITSPYDSSHVSYNALQGLESQLIVQTPRLSAGRHRLQLSAASKYGYQAVSLQVSQIIIQNSTDSVNLNLIAIPPIEFDSSSSSTARSTSLSLTSNSPSPSTRHDSTQRPEVSGLNQGTIAGIILSISGFLLLLVFVACRIRRRARTAQQQLADAVRQDYRAMILSPFVIQPTPPPGRSLGGTQPHRTFRAKLASHYGGLGLLPRSMNPLREDNRPRNRQRRVRYVVHQDGGEVLDSGNELGEEIEGDHDNLPPLYSKVGISQAISVDRDAVLPESSHHKP